jgi:hypothetical protein
MSINKAYKWLKERVSEDSIPLEDDEDVRKDIKKLLKRFDAKKDIKYINKIFGFDRWDEETRREFTILLQGGFFVDVQKM